MNETQQQETKPATSLPFEIAFKVRFIRACKEDVDETKATLDATDPLQSVNEYAEAFHNHEVKKTAYDIALRAYALSAIDELLVLLGAEVTK